MPLVPVSYDPFAPENLGDPEAAGLAAASTAMQPAVTAHIAGVGNDLLQWGQQQQGNADRLSGASLATRALDPQGIETAVNIGLGSGPGAIRAFHGSPYNFDAFDVNKIGTGEGAQVQGKGLYFASQEPTAAIYRDGVKDMSALDTINKQMSSVAHEMDQYRKPGTYREFNDPRGYDLANEYDRLMAEKQKPGHMYEVNINAEPEHMLDWDKSFAEQHPNVQKAIKDQLAPTPDSLKYWRDFMQQDFEESGPFGYRQDRFDRALNEAVSHGGYGPEFGNRVWGELHEASPNIAPEFRDFLEKHGSGLSDSETGAQLYNMLVNKHSNDAVASDVLLKAGIPGIKYLDQLSRAQGQGSHNYVVFDDKIIDILRKYGLAGLISGGAMTLSGTADAKTHLIPVPHDPFGE